MLTGFYMIHPRHHCIFTLPFFVAFGRWLGPPARLRGVVKDREGNQLVEGKVVLSDRRFWAMVFHDIPRGEEYQLSIKAGAGGDEVVANNLAVKGFAGIIISYPTMDDLPVGSTFITYGNTNTTSALMASLSPNGGGTVDYLWGPPTNPPYWAFQFDGVTPGTYTLTVEGGGNEADAFVDIV